MNLPVSIIIPTYNYAAFIKECIESILAQSFQNYEILVIDDGSSDDTPQVLEGISDHRLHVVRTPNRGVSSARNTGLELAQGDLIAFLDADDRWLPHKLEAQVAVFDAAPEVGFVFSNFVRFNEDGDQFSDQFSYALELKNLSTTRIPGEDAYIIHGNALTMLLSLSDMPWYPSANMVRASLAKSERFPKHRRIAEDVDYFFRIWRKTQAAFIPEICAELRRHGSNATVTQQFSANLLMIDVLTGIEDLPLNNEQAIAVQKRKSREWTSLGHRQWRNSLYFEAAGAYIHAIRYPGRRINSLKHLLVIPIVIIVNILKYTVTAIFRRNIARDSRNND